jgi:release factor glutamine methyltransferase
VPIFDEGEAESFFYLILEEKQQLKRIDLALNPDLTFSNEQMVVWNSFLEQLKREVPIQYLLGKTSFYGLDFEVNPSVLIPRSETEELVDWIIKSLKSRIGNPKLQILDIGTGSGCIAISLAKNIENAQVFAIDISDKALATAKKNVLNNEPHLALFVADNDALIFYKKIAKLALKNLTQNGELFFEINQYLGQEMIEMLEKMNFSTIELSKDIYGNDRMIRAMI